MRRGSQSTEGYSGGTFPNAFERAEFLRSADSMEAAPWNMPATGDIQTTVAFTSCSPHRDGLQFGESAFKALVLGQDRRTHPEHAAL